MQGGLGGKRVVTDVNKEAVTVTMMMITIIKRAASLCCVLMWHLLLQVPYIHYLI